MISSRRRRSVARLLVAAALFAQAAFAFAACDLAGRNPAQSISETRQPCHQPETNVTLCVGHCLASDQSLDKPALFVPEFPPVVMFVLVRMPPLTVSLHPKRERVNSIAGPPPRILFQSFLI